MALLDKIKNQLANPMQQQDTSLGGQTEGIRGLLRAKTGKELASGTGPKQSSLQEKMAERQTAIGGQQLQQKGQIQAEQIGQREADITQQGDIQTKQFEEQGKDIQASADRQTNALLQQFESGMKSLDNNKNIADLEQVGFNLRLQNDQYIKQLQQEGTKARLDDQVEFKKQIAQTALKDQQDLFMDEMAFDRVINADDREFSQQLANMDIDYAMGIAENNIKANQSRQVASGVGSLVSGGVEVYSAFKKKPEDKTPETEISGAANLPDSILGKKEINNGE